MNIKTLLAIFFLSSFFLQCGNDKNPLESKNDNGKVKLDASIVNNYKEDAKLLYFHEIISDSTHANYNNTILDTNEINKILEIIQSVYNLDSPERDTVFEIYQIHARYCYSFNSIYLKVNPDLPEIENMVNGVIPTGNNDLDNILITYHFDSVKTAYSYPRSPWLTIYSSYEYNMIPIEKEFNNISSIILAEISKGCVGDGNNISLTRPNDSATIIFSIGSGDCPAGCIYHKYWEFNVINNKAEFIKSYEN